jgi:D-serine deaminase-like pyridoxal phosphate-dependent protein
MPSHPAAAALAAYEDQNKKIHAKDIIDAEDQLAEIRDLVQAAFQLDEGRGREGSATLQAVLFVIVQKVDALDIVLADVRAYELAAGI